MSGSPRAGVQVSSSGSGRLRQAIRSQAVVIQGQLYAATDESSFPRLASGDTIPFEEISSNDNVVAIDGSGVVTVKQKCTLDVDYRVTVRDDVTGAPRQTRILTYLDVDGSVVRGTTGAIWVQTDAYDGSCGGRTILELDVGEELRGIFTLRPPSVGDRRVISASLTISRVEQTYV